MISERDYMRAEADARFWDKCNRYNKPVQILRKVRKVRKVRRWNILRVASLDSLVGCGAYIIGILLTWLIYGSWILGILWPIWLPFWIIIKLIF